MGKHYFLKFDERGNQCLYDERGNKLVCGDIYDILGYVRSHGGGTIYVDYPSVTGFWVVRDEPH